MTTCQRPSSSVGQRAKALPSQVSTSASGTGSPLPSSTRPARRTPSGSATGPSGQGRPIARYGPTVWPGVSSAMGLVHRRLAVPAQDDVELVGERPVLLRVVEAEARDHPL